MNALQYMENRDKYYVSIDRMDDGCYGYVEPTGYHYNNGKLVFEYGKDCYGRITNDINGEFSKPAKLHKI